MKPTKSRLFLNATLNLAQWWSTSILLDLGSDVFRLVFASELKTTSLNISIVGNKPFFKSVLQECVRFKMIFKQTTSSLTLATSILTPSGTDKLWSRSVALLWACRNYLWHQVTNLIRLFCSLRTSKRQLAKWRLESKDWTQKVTMQSIVRNQIHKLIVEL
jgi:hypothetical protein